MRAGAKRSRYAGAFIAPHAAHSLALGVRSGLPHVAHGGPYRLARWWCKALMLASS
jgi:hypothetical protein